MTRATTPPALLFDADYYGTLAAVRDLGRHGIPVTVASPRRLSPARWSRFTTARPSCPSKLSPDFIPWVLEEGRRRPGQILLASSDDVALLFAIHREALGEHFRLYHPGLPTFLALLDKRRLHDEARAVGLESPLSWFPESPADLERLAPELTYPLLIKQRIQALSLTLSKGLPIGDRRALASAYVAFAEQNYFAPPLPAIAPELRWPLLQAFLPEDSRRIYTLSGFITQDGGAFATRAAVKVLSFPRTLGVGLCLESAAVDPALEEQVISLCRRVGYFGIFQCEFLEHGPKRLLIDFNPRFHNFLGFETGRGLHQAWLGYLAASGRRDELVGELERARASGAVPDGSAYCNSFLLDFQQGLQRVTGKLPAGDDVRWREWRAKAAHLVDAVHDDDDPQPARWDRLMLLAAGAQHPRSFLRKMLQS